ncbi:MFS transporter [Caulobacter mirabilis]|uniref:Glycoside transporter n=1 Tax=Caulobacter mirabilis TaxID=69666 RepID=A0A2D2AWR0_9CAUL|nr:MFS transporter [Caulobacter mirabilis]ATQ42415.1 glycoside transporter [Caulobacter mirabilis]
MSQGARLTAARKIAIGAGDFGFNLYWQTAGLYLLFFYTDGLGVPAATAGLIYMAALIWDAALDPVIGVIADRTRTRWGRYRPYFLFGAPLLAVTFVATFVGPAYPTVGAVAFAAGTHILFRTLYAVVSIPYASLFARITRDSAQRGDLAGIRMVFAALGAVGVAALTLPVVQALGTPEDPRRGWAIVGAVYGVLATLIILGVAWAAKGLDVADETPPAPRPVGQVLRSLLSNRALLLVLGAVLVSSFASTMFGKNLLYYFKYVVGKPELGSAALALSALVAVLFVPVWTVVIRFIGKRNTWLVGSIPGLAGLVLWHLADGHGLPMLFGSLALQAFGGASYVVCFWAMLPDTVEYGEWKSGVRTESLVFGLTVLGQKAALGLGAGFLGLLLTHVGYVANQAQTPETLAGIKAMMFWWPFVGGLISLALIFFYPLDRKTHGRMVEEIAARAGSTPVSNS